MAYNKRGSTDVLDYLSQKGYRRDEQFRELLNMFALTKKLQQERGQAEVEWEGKEADRELRAKELQSLMGLREAQTGLTEARTEELGRPPIPPKQPDWKLKAEEFVRTGIARNLGEAYQMLYKMGKHGKQVKPGETPEQLQLKATFKKHGNLVKSAQARLTALRKNLAPRAKLTQSESFLPQPPAYKLKAQQELENVDILIDKLDRITASSMASGRPLMPEYEEAIMRLLKAKSGDIGSGKLLQDISASWKEAIAGYQVGQRKKTKDGKTWEYVGNDQWQQIK